MATFDRPCQCSQVLSLPCIIVIRGFINKYSADTQSGFLIIYRPASVALYFGKCFVVGLPAVVDSNIAYCIHVGIRVESRDLSCIVSVRESCVSRATIWVDNDKEIQLWIGLNSKKTYNLLYD